MSDMTPAEAVHVTDQFGALANDAGFLPGVMSMLGRFAEADRNAGRAGCGCACHQSPTAAPSVGGTPPPSLTAAAVGGGGPPSSRARGCPLGCGVTAHARAIRRKHPMTTIEERAPLTIEQRVERMEALGVRLAAALGIDQAPTRNDVPAEFLGVDPSAPAVHVDLGDPLGPFRLPDGSVAYLSVPVGGLRAGDWFQRQHGDEGWHQVRPLIFTEDRVGVPFDETGLEWFGREQMVRVARTPEHVAFVQEQRAVGQ